MRRGGFGSRHDAAEALGRVRVPVAGSTAAGALTVAEWLEVWATTRSRAEQSTRRYYRLYVRRYLTPMFRLTLLAELDAPKVKDVFAQLLRDGIGGCTVSLASAHAAFKTLRTALNAAVAEGYLLQNPARCGCLPMYRRPRAVVRTEELIARWRQTGERPPVAVWTAPQVARFLTAHRNHPLYAAYHLIAFRGLRRGEVAGLRWIDVDLDAGLMHVTYQVQSAGRGSARALIDPKTPTSRAWVALDAVTAHVLREHRVCQLRMLTAFGGEDSGFVFQMSDGTPFDPAYLTRTFRTLSQRCDLPPIRLHDLRHTAASLALQAGVSLKIVQETLRHSSIVLTADTYVSILPDAAREAADATAALILKHGCLVPGTTRVRGRTARATAVLAARQSANSKLVA